MIDGTVTKLVWSRLTDAERAAVVKRLIKTVDDDTLWEAINVGVNDVVSATEGVDPLTTKRRATRGGRKPATPAATTTSVDGPKRRGRPPGSKNKPKDAPDNANPFATPFSQQLRDA